MKIKMDKLFNKKNKIKNKKAQFVLLSFVFLALLLLSINYGIIKNNYKENYRESYIFSNMINEVCITAKNSNGTYLDNRLNELKINLNKYCNLHSFNCSLTIYKSPSAPTNLSKLNYSYYNFSLIYEYKNLILNKKFKCS